MRYVRFPTPKQWFEWAPKDREEQFEKWANKGVYPFVCLSCGYPQGFGSSCASCDLCDISQQFDHRVSDLPGM